MRLLNGIDVHKLLAHVNGTGPLFTLVGCRRQALASRLVTLRHSFLFFWPRESLSGAFLAACVLRGSVLLHAIKVLQRVIGVGGSVIS